MFGIANQLLAALALIIVTSVLFESGRRKYSWITIAPLAFVSLTSLVAAVRMLQDVFIPTLRTGCPAANGIRLLKGPYNFCDGVPHDRLRMDFVCRNQAFG